MISATDTSELDNSLRTNTYFDSWANGSIQIRSPLEVYQANVRLAQLIIDMLSWTELRYAYKLASLLSDHIVARLAQNGDGKAELKLNQLPSESTTTTGLVTPSVSSSEFSALHLKSINL
ncbi:unnamed protein product [Echinostoma caproni]|uniref:Uncharacterized protein n=1 Tax=Echinostoma caproni TaxID=27848 RepID=A0A183B8G6_9TREM|nr:unnamed protein product [Echinostoma caproni]